MCKTGSFFYTVYDQWKVYYPFKLRIIVSSIDNRGENEFADEESNLVGMSEEYGEEKEDQTVSKKTEQKQNPKDERNSG